MKLIYKKDENDHEMLCDETGKHQVMMEWEKPYMEFSIEKLNPTGHVLEIGFGMGYSATSICSYTDVSEYQRHLMDAYSNYQHLARRQKTFHIGAIVTTLRVLVDL